MIHLLSLAILALGFAIPTMVQGSKASDGFTLHLPNGSPLQKPDGLKLLFLTLGVGTQNYTCTAGAWTSVGATSDLRDLSGDVAAAKTISNDVGRGGKSNIPAPDLSKFPVIGKHFFAGPAGKIFPVFAINKQQAIATKVAGTPSPLNPKRNVDWLQLSVKSGGPGRSIYRTSTRGGRPPAGACKAQAHVEVKYSALYTFWA